MCVTRLVPVATLSQLRILCWSAGERWKSRASAVMVGVSLRYNFWFLKLAEVFSSVILHKNLLIYSLNMQKCPVRSRGRVEDRQRESECLMQAYVIKCIIVLCNMYPAPIVFVMHKDCYNTWINTWDLLYALCAPQQAAWFVVGTCYCCPVQCWNGGSFAEQKTIILREPSRKKSHISMDTFRTPLSPPPPPKSRDA